MNEFVNEFVKDLDLSVTEKLRDEALTFLEIADPKNLLEKEINLTPMKLTTIKKIAKLVLRFNRKDYV